MAAVDSTRTFRILLHAKRGTSALVDVRFRLAQTGARLISLEARPGSPVGDEIRVDFALRSGCLLPRTLKLVEEISGAAVASAVELLAGPTVAP